MEFFCVSREETLQALGVDPKRASAPESASADAPGMGETSCRLPSAGVSFCVFSASFRI